VSVYRNFIISATQTTEFINLQSDHFQTF